MTLVKKLTILVNLDTLVSVNRTAAKLMSVWAVEIGVISMNEFGGSNAHTKRAGKLLIGNIVLQKWPSFSIHITAYLCAKKLLFRYYKQPYSVLNDNVLIMFFLNMGQSRPLFRLLSSPPHITNQLQIEKSIDGVLEIRTQGHRMVGADVTTELWQPHM